MKTIQNLIMLIILFSWFAYGQEPTADYFNVSQITQVSFPYIPSFSGGRPYFTLLEIASPDILDIAIPYNYKQFSGMVQSRDAFWALNYYGVGFTGNNYIFQEFGTGNDNNVINGSVTLKLHDAAIRGDLVIGRANGIKVYWNQNGSITGIQQDISSVNANLIETGSFDNSDSREDVTVKDGGHINIYKNLGNGYLSSTYYYQFNSPVSINKFRVRQINDLASESGYIQENLNDRADLIVASGTHIYVFLNNNNQFISNPAFADIDVGYTIHDLEVKDVTNDGYNDIIVTGLNSNTATVYKNIQGQFFYYAWSVTNSNYIGTEPLINVSDLNKDGNSDLIFVSFEGRTSVFINKYPSNLFSAVPDQSFSGFEYWVYYWGSVTKLATADLKNTGSNLLIASWYSTSQPPKFGVSVMNSITQNPPPPPPILQGMLMAYSYYYHPYLRINNRGERDWEKYKIYKMSPSTNNQLVFLTYSYGDYIDFSEFVVLGGDSPDFNCYYIVRSVDYNAQESINSLPAYYTVGIPSCDGCGGDSPDYKSYNFELPKEVKISNFPNPFNPITKIFYTLPDDGNVKISVYNSLGKLIEELYNGFRKKGPYMLEFNGANLASGIYYYTIETGEFKVSKKMVLIK